MNVSTVSSTRETPKDRLKPRLAFFHSPASGPCRKAEAFLAQVLQQRRNHETFDIVRVNVDERPDLADRFHVDRLPTLLVIEGHTVRRRIIAPRGGPEIAQGLAAWLK